MKTRVLLRLSLLLSCLLVILSCDKHRRVPNVPTGFRDRMVLDRCFNMILDVQEVNIKEAIRKDSHFTVTQMGKFYSNLRWHRPSEEEVQKFNALADQIGDYEIPKKYVVYTHLFPETSTLGIKQIEAIALTDYDEQHKVGSSLGNILELIYASYDKDFAKKPMDEEGCYWIREEHITEVSTDFKGVRYLRLRNTWGKPDAIISSRVIEGRFTKRPSPNVAKVKVRVTLMDNQVIEQELEIKP